MADKSFIQMKLDKDNALNELKQVVPGLRALQYYHNNPDSSFANTLDLLAEDIVPFYAAHKYGAEPEDYIKEAFLLGMTPTKAKQIKNYIKRHPNSTRYENVSNELYDMFPDGNMNSDKVNKPGYRGNYFEEEASKVTSGEPYFEYKNINDLLTDIDESAVVHSEDLARVKPIVDEIQMCKYLMNRINEARANGSLEIMLLGDNYGSIAGTQMLRPEMYNEVYNRLSKRYKDLQIELNEYNANTDFNNNPYIKEDISDREYSDIIKDYYTEQTKNLKYPFQ